MRSSTRYLVWLLLLQAFSCATWAELRDSAMTDRAMERTWPLTYDDILHAHEPHFGRLDSATREPITDDIAHYRFDVRVGKSRQDVVRIHRVVRERRPYRPRRTLGAVFMTHGASLNFEGVYLRAGAENPTAETSIALYLADSGIDVWGMDFGWTRTPADTTDFDFMEDWGVQRDADHTLRAMSVARWLRGVTGQGFGRIHLLGYSYSVAVIYAAAGQESQGHRLRRIIGGLIPVDGAMKYSNTDRTSRVSTCDNAASIAAEIDAGLFADDGGLGAGFLSLLATTAPDDPSPVFAGLTNYQAPLLFGAHSYLLLTAPAPEWHFVAGDFAAMQPPTDLLHTDADRWIRFLGTLSPFMPNRARYESSAVICDEDELTFDDHLGQISVPILYVGAGGGFGDYGEYTATRTASSDVTSHIVELQPNEVDTRLEDYGHADLFLADDADTLVWEAIRQWLIQH